MEYNHRKLGERVSLYRNISKLSQKEFASMCGLSQGYIGNLERGVGRSVSMETLNVIAEKLNVSIDDLLVDSLAKYSQAFDIADINFYEKEIKENISTFTVEQLKLYSQFLEKFRQYKINH